VANEGTGMVLSLLLGAANRPDRSCSKPSWRTSPGRHPKGGRRRRPDKCHADKGYDYRHCREYLTGRGIKVRIARRGTESSERLGRHRWKAERTIAWLFGCRRLRIRYDRGSERFYAFGLLACCRLAFNRYTDHTTRRPDRPLLAW
jgi:transposase